MTLFTEKNWLKGYWKAFGVIGGMSLEGVGEGI